MSANCRPNRKHAMQTLDASIIAKHLLTAAIWADCEEGTRPRETKQARQEALTIAQAFAKSIPPEVLEQLQELPEYWSHPDCNGHLEAAIGHDLWLTATGAGVGFWDRDALDLPCVADAAHTLGDWLSGLVETLGMANGKVSYEQHRGRFYVRWWKH